MSRYKKTGRLLLMYLIFSATAIILSYTILSTFVLKDYQIYTFNKVRVLTNSLLNTIEKEFVHIGDKILFDDKVKKELEAVQGHLEIVDMKGQVIFDSQVPDIREKNKMVDIKTYVHMDAAFRANEITLVKFAFPIVVEGEQRGNAVITMPEHLVLKYSQVSLNIMALIPVILILIGIFIMGIVLFIGFNKRVMRPIRQLDLSANEIAKGNLERKINYYDDNDLGRFSRSFDLMRMELKDALDRQAQYEKARKELVTKISHDLRTPIASIKAYVEGLRDGIAKGPEMVEKYLNVINTKTDSLVNLIDDLFDHSLAEVGKFSIHKEEQYSKKLFENMFEAYTIQFENNPINFNVQGNVPDVLINVDQARIEQVVANLIQNAEKYTPEGGFINCQITDEVEHIRISISDTGYGVAEEELPHIFDNFYRGEKFRTRDFDGSGLGLSICKYIVEQHGGTIEVRSKLDKGSTFSFTIPKV